MYVAEWKEYLHIHNELTESGMCEWVEADKKRQWHTVWLMLALRCPECCVKLRTMVNKGRTLVKFYLIFSLSNLIFIERVPIVLLMTFYSFEKLYLIFFFFQIPSGKYTLWKREKERICIKPLGSTKLQAYSALFSPHKSWDRAFIL